MTSFAKRIAESQPIRLIKVQH